MALTSDRIAELWPEHAEHNDARNLPSFDRDAGYLCGCGVHLGWPVQDEPPEADEFEPDEVNTTFQRPASAAGAAAWDKAAAQVQKARQGAYGTWGATEFAPLPEEPEDAEVVEEPDASWFPAEQAAAVESDIAESIGVLREHADGPVADEAQTYSVAGADDPATHVTPDGMVYAEETTDTPYGKFDAEPDTFLGGLPEEHDAVFGKPDSPAVIEGREYDAAQVALNEEDEAQRRAPEPGSGTPILPAEGDLADPVSSALPAPLDPTEVYTPHDVELAIVDILGRLERGEFFLRQQISRLHLADYNLLMRKAASLAKSDRRAADQREAEANLACAKEIYEQSEAAMLVRALRDTMHTLRSRLSGYQSVGRSVGASVNAPSYRP
jgi:hypothetical protein